MRVHEEDRRGAEEKCICGRLEEAGVAAGLGEIMADERMEEVRKVASGTREPGAQARSRMHTAQHKSAGVSDLRLELAV